MVSEKNLRIKYPSIFRLGLYTYTVVLHFNYHIPMDLVDLKATVAVFLTS